MPPTVVNDELAPLASATLQRGFLWLRFPARLEAAYQGAVAAERQRVLSKGLAYCAPLYLILLGVDHEMLHHDSLGASLVLRLGIFMPLLALAWWLTRRQATPPKVREWLLAAIGIAACLLSVLVTLGSQSELRIQHLVILNAIVIYTVQFGRFWPMLALCLAVFDMHLFALYQFGGLLSDIGVGTTLLLMANCTYMAYGCYLMEQASRTSFLIDLQEADMDAELERTTERLGSIAREDALTGLANRRHFTEFLHGAQARAVRDGSPLALVLVDVDHFKAYNDHHGHPAGDACLCRVGQALRSAVPDEAGLVARWGGEEFAIVLPGADQAQALQAAERMRRAVCDSAIPHAASQTAPVVTISLGVALLPSGAQDGEAGCAALLALADQGLYVSKTSGRNRVTLAAPEMPGDADVHATCGMAGVAH